jgi:hypothetical protein
MAQTPQQAAQTEHHAPSSGGEFPRMMYHENGQSRMVRNEDEAKALGGGGWSSQMNDNVVMAMRQACGSIAEVIEPVQRVAQERTNK